MNWSCLTDNETTCSEYNLKSRNEEKDTIEFLINENEKLKNKNENLQNKLNSSINKVNNDIDIFVEKWYVENNDAVDIGVIKIGFLKIDIFPDYLEKYIYKKILKILYSYLLETIDKTDSPN